MNSNAPSQPWLQSKSGTRYEVPEVDQYPLLVGRVAPGQSLAQPQVAIVQNEETKFVSRKHAHLYRDDVGVWSIEDAGSSSGLFVDGTKVPPGQRVPLTDGIRIGLGNFEITYHMPTVVMDKPAPAAPEGPVGSETMRLEVEIEQPGEAAPAAPEPPAAVPEPPQQPAAPEVPPAAEQSPAEAAAEPPAASVPPQAPAEAEGHATPEDGGTMIIENFVPSSIPDAEGGAERVFMDTWAGDQVHPLELVRRPGQSEWTIGRALSADPATPHVGHVVVPNLPEFNTVSRKHVSLACDDQGNWTIRNLSGQGSKLNFTGLSNEEATPIGPGDKLVMGNRIFIFRKGAQMPGYQAADFELSSLVSEALAGGANLDADDMADTRELAPGYFKRDQTVEEDKAWGFLNENKLMQPRRFPLIKRKTRIGRHPLNSDIRMDDVGIEDLHATIEWHGNQCKVHSRAKDSPVRVNHAAYRVSPPLKSGAIMTIGNQEFNIQINSEPPEATSTVVIRGIKRLSAVSAAGVIFICVGVLFGAKVITPSPQTYTPPDVPSSAQIYEDVVGDYGLAGLQLLEEHFEQGNEELDLAAILDRMRDINEMNRLINKTTDADFRDAVHTIEAKMERNKDVFELAGLSADMANRDWYQQLKDDFHRRRGEAYESEWGVFLTALSDNNIVNAEILLRDMVNTQQEKLDAGRTAIKYWNNLTAAMRAIGQKDILDTYQSRINASTSAEYLDTVVVQFDDLRQQFQQIETLATEPTEALMRSSEFPAFKQEFELVVNTVDVLKAYQEGDTTRFDAAYALIPQANRTTLLKTMDQNLDDWDAWKARASRTGGDPGNAPLISDLRRLQFQFNMTQDADAPVNQQIQSRLSGFGNQRAQIASRLRRDAAAMSPSWEKLFKLLDAVQYDSSTAAAQEIDSLVSQLCGQARDNVDTYRSQMERARREIRAHFSDGVLSPNDIVAVKQIDTLLGD